jgi:hypothetical protein
MDESIVKIISFAILAVVGYLLAKKLPEPKRGFIWIIWLILLVISGYVGVGTRLVSIGKYSVYLSLSLQGLLFGLLSSWLGKRYLLK